MFTVKQLHPPICSLKSLALNRFDVLTPRNTVQLFGFRLATKPNVIHKQKRMFKVALSGSDYL